MEFQTKSARLLFSFLLAIAATAGAQGPSHPINPHTGIGWPAGCDIYVVSTNSCVSAQGTAGNPGGLAGQFQINVGGVSFGGVTPAQAYQGIVAFNQIDLVSAAPFNASCDALIMGTSISIATSGVVTGATFLAGDAGKTLVAWQNPNAPYQGTIASVVSGVATVSPAPGSTFASSSWEYGTKNTTQIQAAFDDAYANARTVQFPAGRCLTGTITYKGQSFFGADRTRTNIQGLPGQDVFAGINSSAMVYLSNTQIHDLSIITDDSVNAASSLVGGNNTFPDRISGTSGGGGTIGGAIIPLTNPPAMTNAGFGPPFTFDACTGASISAGSHNLNCPNGNFAGASGGTISTDVVGQTITVNGAGTAGAPLVTTIASVTDGNNVVLTAAAATTVSNASGSFGKSQAPPWYFGNCGMAFPDSDGAWLGGIPPTFWNFYNINFGTIGGYARGGHSCAIFMQVQGYGWNYSNITVTQYYGGIIEGLPLKDFGAPFPWSPDTFYYTNVNYQFNSIPAVTYNGGNRHYSGINIYGGEQLFTYGLFQLAPNNQGGNITSVVDNMFFECYPPNLGEASRYIGVVTLNQGGGLNECAPTALQWVAWYANNSSSQMNGIFGLKIFGSNNTFDHVQPSAIVNDTGYNNHVSIDATTVSKYSGRPPRAPINQLDGTFLLSPTYNAPFTSAADLLVYCPEMNFAFNTGVSTPGPGCTADPNDPPNTTGWYAHIDSTNYPGGANLGPTNEGTGPTGKFFIVGDRLPAAPMQLVIMARCNLTCLDGVNVSYYNPATPGTQIGLATASLGFNTTWTSNAMPVNLSNVPFGDIVTVSMAPNWGGGISTQDIAIIGFTPVVPVTTNNSPCVFNYFVSPPTYIQPSPQCVVDATSITGYAADYPVAPGDIYSIFGVGLQWNLNTLNPPTFPKTPITLGITMKATSATTANFNVTCDGAPYPETLAAPLTTSYATFYLTLHNPGSCATFGNITLNLNSSTQTVRISNLQMLPVAVPQPQPSAAFQVPCSSLVGSFYYYFPCSVGIEVPAAFAGVPANAQVMTFVPITVAFNVPSSCTGSLGGAKTAATGTAVFTAVKHAGGPLGASTTLCSFTFSAAGTVAAISGTGGSVAAGDWIEIDGPGTADATLATIGIGLSGIRNQ